MIEAHNSPRHPAPDSVAALRVPVALSIAGSDSGGGAGVQADLKSFSALGVYGATALTALTAQNTRTVSAIHDVPPAFVIAQLHTVLDDLPVDAIKIGMLSSVAIIEAVADVLANYPGIPVVLDPVMIAKSGDALLAEDAHDAMLERLCPLATLLTPNLPELAILSGQDEARSESEAIAQARALGPRAIPEAGAGVGTGIGTAAPAVLAKGGHRAGDQVVDLLVQGEHTIRYVHPRLATANTHGTGCSLSAAIAAHLAKGHALQPSVGESIAWLQRAIGAADTLGIGSGHGPVHHFHAWWSAS